MSSSLTVLLATITAIVDEAAAKERDHQLAVRAALAADKPEPQANVPSADSASWVRWAARMFRDADCDRWYSDLAVRAAGRDYVATRIELLRTLPEFVTLEGHEIEVRWTTRAMVERDIGIERVLLGRAKVVSEEERLTWPSGDCPPSWRLTLSLPAAVLADSDELDRGLHALLCSFGLRDHRPVLRRPDVVAHAANLARYGATSIRETLAVACAMRHPATQARMREYGFDPSTGQGLLWAPQLPRQVQLDEVH